MQLQKITKAILIFNLIFAILITILSDQVEAVPFFTMDMSQGAAPSAGWPGTVGNSATHTTTFLTGVGPSGQNAYRFRQIHAPSAPGYGGEFDWGWNGDLEAQDPPQGARRYYRFRMRWTPETNFRGLYWQDGSSINLINKILIIGDGCGSRCRFILQYRGTGTTNQAQYIRMQLDGGVDPAEIGPVNTGQWMNIQLELDSSTTTNSADGGYKMWFNNDNYNSPSAVMSGIQLNPTRWRYVFLGAYNNNGLAADGVHEFLMTDFQADTEFDPNWNTGGNNPSPTDTTPPSQVTGLTTTTVSNSQINLQWNAATDNVAVTGYRIYRNNAQIATTTSTSYSDSSLSASTTYQYKISAYDAAGNSATNSTTVSATTQTTIITPPQTNCETSTTTFTNTPINPLTGQFTIEYDATPNAQNLDALTGLSNIQVNSYTDMAITIRFANTNQIDARNAATYTSTTPYLYTAGIQYHFKLEGNVITKTYNAYVNAPGQQPTQIANNYAFRTEQQNINSLNYKHIMSSSGTHTLCNFITNTTPLPQTLPLEGDVNNDRIVNLLDLNAIVAHFGKTSGYPTGINLAGSSAIDLFDAMVIIRNWGRTQ